MNLEASLHSLLSFAFTLTRPTSFNLLRQNIVFSYSERIPVSFSWLFHYFSFFFCYFTFLLICTKIILLLLFYYFFYSWKLFLFFPVPGCSRMFRDVPCSWFYRRPRKYGNGCSLFIFIRSTLPVISGDFLTGWNAITVRKGRQKGQFWGNSYFWIEFFLKEVLGLLPYDGNTFIPTTTTTTSLFQIKYSLQSLCPQLAKAIRGGYKRKRKIV